MRCTFKMFLSFTFAWSRASTRAPNSRRLSRDAFSKKKNPRQWFVFVFPAKVSKAQCYELRAIVCWLGRKSNVQASRQEFKATTLRTSSTPSLCSREPVANVNVWDKGFRSVSAHAARHSRVSEGSVEQCVWIPRASDYKVQAVFTEG